MPTQSKILDIHYDGNRQYVKNKCDPNHISVNRYNKKHLNRKIYPNRKVTEFEPSFLKFYCIGKGNMPTNSIVDNDYGFDIELLVPENRKQTYNKNNMIELYTSNDISFAKYEYKSQIFGNETFELV